jgi:ketosteroid isomerase-like protein
MPGGILDTAYEALGAGDSGPLVGLLGDEFEWVEPELAGYPLSGAHRGPDGVAAAFARLGELLEGLVVYADEVVDAGSRVTVTGVMRGRPAGTAEDWALPFAHVWVLDGDTPVRMRAYFDRSRLTVAGARSDLAEVADDLLEQAAEIRRQWARLGDALRAAGLEADAGGDDAPAPAAGSASARLAAVDMAEDGATREEVEAYLREELGVDEPAPILDEVFGVDARATLDERAAELEATRLSRLFARNRG